MGADWLDAGDRVLVTIRYLRIGMGTILKKKAGPQPHQLNSADPLSVEGPGAAGDRARVGACWPAPAPAGQAQARTGASRAGPGPHRPAQGGRRPPAGGNRLLHAQGTPPDHATQNRPSATGQVSSGGEGRVRVLRGCSWCALRANPAEAGRRGVWCGGAGGCGARL
jgi:hypothetical protein